MTGEFVQVQNPKTRKYVLINKTKGKIIEVGKDENPFPDVEIINHHRTQKLADDITNHIRMKNRKERIAIRRNPFHRTNLCIRRIIKLSMHDMERLEQQHKFIKENIARMEERGRRTGRSIC